MLPPRPPEPQPAAMKRRGTANTSDFFNIEKPPRAASAIRGPLSRNHAVTAKDLFGALDREGLSSMAVAGHGRRPEQRVHDRLLGRLDRGQEEWRHRVIRQRRAAARSGEGDRVVAAAVRS